MTHEIGDVVDDPVAAIADVTVQSVDPERTATRWADMGRALLHPSWNDRSTSGPLRDVPGRADRSRSLLEHRVAGGS